jgi:polyhydroxybutyrate depolymerase
MRRIVVALAVVVSGCSMSVAPVSPPAGNGNTGGVGSGGGGSGGDGSLGPSPGSPPVGSCAGLKTQPADANWTLSFGGADRNFDVHVPMQYDAVTPMALVIDSHGYSSNAMQEAFLTNMNAKADAVGFISVHPNGLNSSWNAGACCGQSAMDNVDDIGFINAMLDKLESELCVDKQRIFATGMSNGGFLSNRIGCEMAGRVAAIAPVAGVTGVTGCAPARSMPVMHFHGTADTLVPYNGSTSLGFPSVPDDFAAWAKRDGCTDQPFQSFMKGDSSCQTYKECGGGAEVILCTVQNGGHTWPGGTPIPSLGNTTTDLSATDAMWDFFMRHPLPSQ